jgi:hypothetical protein
MPSFYPEGNTARSADSIQRGLVKLNSRLYDAVVALGGSTTLTMYPEGTTPYASDAPQRSLNKINTLLTSLIAAMGSGAASATSGTDEPNGSVTGTVDNAMYFQLDGNGDVVTIWLFTGTVGQDTGWVTFPGL